MQSLQVIYIHMFVVFDWLKKTLVVGRCHEKEILSISYGWIIFCLDKFLKHTHTTQILGGNIIHDLFTITGRKAHGYVFNTLHWRHDGRDCVSNHQPHDCLPNRLFRRRSKKTSKFRVTGLCAGNSPRPTQMASNAENVSIWWRHHDSEILH